MKIGYKIAILALLCICVIVALGLFISRNTIVVFSSQGAIGLKERNLTIVAALLMSLFVVPVFILTFAIAWKSGKEIVAQNIHQKWTDSAFTRFSSGPFLLPLLPC